MKKLVSAMTMLLLSIAVMAQDPKPEKEQKNFLAFTVGPSFPFGVFGSTELTDPEAGLDLSTDESGLAKNGYTFEIKYGYQFHKIFGLAASVVYGSNNVDKSFLEDDAEIKVDPWEYYGILAGPRITGTLSPMTSLDFSVLSGVAFANSPRAMIDDEEFLEDDWQTTVPLKLAADLRFNFKNRFLFVGANYTYLQPEFNSIFLSEKVTYRQKMGILGFNAGFGTRF